ncbi:MAG TPA: MazG nucleotide pyrophosphohydrolase domain-containing protein, partial [Steroidobacteraceae bacterium]|nr:MazG nucleotide pyrophosphohydrolase domain-containing protein [Steroidobacteraceae bacterium]
AAAGSELDGVPLALPALTRAVKFGRRAARVGFDWRNATDALVKVDEELAELREAVAADDQPSRIEAEIGDLLFAITNVCRHVGVDPERALRGANGRFESRFRAMEQEAATDGQDLSDLDLEELDRLWNRAKHRERQSPQ